MKLLSEISRYEIKYRITKYMLPELRKYANKYMKVDPYSQLNANRQYTVRSVYFDTPDLDFYYEKVDGLMVRKKLRIRAYNQQSEYAFLEIKRRYVSCILKERAKLPFQRIEDILNGPEQKKLILDDQDYKTQLVAGKFIYNLVNKDLEPSLLVVYEREAYIGKVNSDQRFTLDMNIRVRYLPRFSDLFDGHYLKFIFEQDSVLELKFNNLMPKWMRVMVGELGIRPESISKYCLGIDVTRGELSPKKSEQSINILGLRFDGQKKYTRKVS